MMGRLPPQSQLNSYFIILEFTSFLIPYAWGRQFVTNRRKRCCHTNIHYTCYYINISGKQNMVSWEIILHGLTYMWNLKKKSNIESESREVVARGWRVEEEIEACERIQTFSYKMNEVQDLMYNMVTIGDNTVLYNWNLPRVKLKFLTHTKRINMWGDAHANY